MKKKVLAVVLGMSMVVAMMTGCGASKETSDHLKFNIDGLEFV